MSCCRNGEWVPNPCQQSLSAAIKFDLAFVDGQAEIMQWLMKVSTRALHAVRSQSPLVPDRRSSTLRSRGAFAYGPLDLCLLQYHSLHFRRLSGDLRSALPGSRKSVQNVAFCRRRGRVAEGGGLLNRYTVLKPYPGFESLRLRQFEKGARSGPFFWPRCIGERGFSTKSRSFSCCKSSSMAMRARSRMKSSGSPIV